MAYIVMAYGAMTYVVMVYGVMAYIASLQTWTAPVGLGGYLRHVIRPVAHIVMAYIVMAYIFMAYKLWPI